MVGDELAVATGKGLLSPSVSKNGGSNGVPADPRTGPLGELTPLGMGKGEFQDSLARRITRYVKNVATAVFRPKQIFCPSVVSLAGGKLQYTLSEDVRKIRGEAYDAGLHRGQAQTEKMERYVEGERAIDIFERAKTVGYNQGVGEGMARRAENREECLGGFEDLDYYYNRGPDDVIALIGKKFIQVFDSDDEISIYLRRYGPEKTREMLDNCVERLLDPEREKVALPAIIEDIKT
jgi:hypothetical protein